MARHDQQGKDKNFICNACRESKCSVCIDVLRSTYADRALCTCGRVEHGSAIERGSERERGARMAAPTAPRIICGLCLKTSYHATDIATGYCGYCHDFTNGEVTNV